MKHPYLDGFYIHFLSGIFFLKLALVTCENTLSMQERKIYSYSWNSSISLQLLEPLLQMASFHFNFRDFLIFTSQLSAKGCESPPILKLIFRRTERKGQPGQGSIVRWDTGPFLKNRSSLCFGRAILHGRRGLSL